MDFRLNEEQQMLQDTVARLVRGEYEFEKRLKYSESELGFSEDFWKQLGELGLCAVPFPEELGGFGGSGVDVQSVMTELGRGLCLEPYMQTVILGGGIISQAGSDSQKEDWLGRIATGELKVAVGLQEPQSHYNLNDVETRAKKSGDGYTLNGRKGVLIGGHAAGLIIVSARTSGDSRDADGLSLFAIDPEAAGVDRRTYPTMDGAKGCDVFLKDVKVGADALIGTEGKAGDVIQYQAGRAMAALCAEAVGAMEESIKLTLEYLKTRKQFGVPIGKFQVLQHRMVDMSSELEQARSASILAASVANDEASDERTRTLAAAKNIIGRAGQHISEQAIQLHGGIGMTWEYSLAHYAKRLIMINHQLGDDDHHLEAYAGLLQAS
ncbi:pimeloyl-CoA dehydrogenase small subunit [Marinobacter nanhaiticus D15-8W]|uniref:Acyl-CoA dehydrogenase n=1 Tax=Marinobacter nanhaiticus D15-8W TaxID=626887 RepID=N6W423_9GAMM|nr:acyl-CoA dehydrogenase [Marinobacter nanhaiticus]ENO14899.1 acyl-CoA dehydrogenase [Marinobacter nanhaiticus D15-8W]BES69405.1 pimeloyl-CoA dehydrogenase small subunit [Marinobacter nanhaiticus D15-8W]